MYPWTKVTLLCKNVHDSGLLYAFASICSCDSECAYDVFVRLQGKQPKFINILKSLCSCRDRGILSNQVSVTRLLFDKNYSQLVMPFSIDETRTVIISVPPGCPDVAGGMLPERMIFRDFIGSAHNQIIEYAVLFMCLLCMCTRVHVCMRVYVCRVVLGTSSRCWTLVLKCALVVISQP